MSKSPFLQIENKCSEIAEGDWARRTLHSAAAQEDRVFLCCFQNSKDIIIARINVSIAAKYALMDYYLVAHAIQLTVYMTTNNEPSNTSYKKKQLP